MLGLKKICKVTILTLISLFSFRDACASDIDLNIPSLNTMFNIFGLSITGSQILLMGMGVCVLGMSFGLYEYIRIKNMPAHSSMKMFQKQFMKHAKLI